jgi:hypothetical protein
MPTDPATSFQLLSYALGAALVVVAYFAHLLNSCHCEQCSFHKDERARKKRAADLAKKSAASEKGKLPPGGGWAV